MRYFTFIVLLFSFTASLYGQSLSLAENFFDRGEYAKSLSYYQKAYELSEGNSIAFQGVVKSLQQLGRFEEAGKFLSSRLHRKQGPDPDIYIHLGHNYALQDRKVEAEEYYEKAIASIDQEPKQALGLGMTFEKYSLLDYAAKAYSNALKVLPDSGLELKLARIYGEQGDIETMLAYYLDLIVKNKKYIPYANREFGRFITEDSNAPANVSLRKTLLKRIQTTPDPLYNEMLSWLYIQEKEFGKAFLQEKAIYKRAQAPDLSRLMNLLYTSKKAEDYKVAREIIAFIVDEASPSLRLRAKQMKLNLDIDQADPGQFDEIKDEFENLIAEAGPMAESIDLNIDYAHFLAFKNKEPLAGHKILEALLNSPASQYDQARIKLELADILVLQKKFNEALLIYTQVQKNVRNDQMAQDALFKIARTSYFKGDFEWAQTQLDVLKKSTSQLIANDAMELSLLIKDNSGEDSTYAALKKYSFADLLAYQGQTRQAIAELSRILKEHQGEKIEDEALLKQGILFEQQKKYPEAQSNYLMILENHGKDLLADNAAWHLATMYEGVLGDLEMAQKYYEKIMFEFEDSIYFMQARRNFRKLRGDSIE